MCDPALGGIYALHQSSHRFRAVTNTNSVRQYGSVRVNDETAPSMAHNAGTAVLTGLPVR